MNHNRCLSNTIAPPSSSTKLRLYMSHIVSNDLRLTINDSRVIKCEWYSAEAIPEPAGSEL